MLLALLLAQAAAAQAPPDIELNIRARAKSAEIERKGEAKLQVIAEPDARSHVEARVEPLPEGRTSLRNVEVNVRAEARIGEGVEIDAKAETAAPQ
ncbi:MAG TPA: hypothetical protein VF655_03520 [Allosphingosinicella sp.]|jgi:hypothetical protein